MQDECSRIAYESDFLVLPLAYGQKIRKEAAHQPLLKTEKPGLRIFNEGVAALHCIPRITFEVF